MPSLGIPANRLIWRSSRHISCQPIGVQFRKFNVSAMTAPAAPHAAAYRGPTLRFINVFVGFSLKHHYGPAVSPAGPSVMMGQRN